MKKGQVEQTPRVDSFRLGARRLLADGKWIPVSRGFDYDDEDNEIALLGDERVTLSNVFNATGSLTYFRCPWCGQRVRFLYLPEYKCRACANLNYRSQQLSKRQLAEERLYEERLERANDPITREIVELEHRLETLKRRHKKAIRGVGWTLKR